MAEIELADQKRTGGEVVDLIRARDNGVEIADFKTGSPKNEHVTQLQLYARLLLNDPAINPTRLRVAKLTIIYVDNTVNVEVPNDAELAALATGLDERARRAKREGPETSPEARPSPEACSFCDVRQMCPMYWTPEGQSLGGLAAIDEGLVDAEVRLYEKVAPTTWRASVVWCGSIREATMS